MQSTERENNFQDNAFNRQTWNEQATRLSEKVLVLISVQQGCCGLIEHVNSVHGQKFITAE